MLPEHTDCVRLVVSPMFEQPKCMCPECQLRRTGERLRAQVERLEQELSAARGVISVAREDLRAGLPKNALAVLEQGE